MREELKKKLEESMGSIQKNYSAAKVSAETLYDNVVAALFNNIEFLKKEIEGLENRVKELESGAGNKPSIVEENKTE